MAERNEREEPTIRSGDMDKALARIVFVSDLIASGLPLEDIDELTTEQIDALMNPSSGGDTPPNPGIQKPS